MTYVLRCDGCGKDIDKNAKYLVVSPHDGTPPVDEDDDDFDDEAFEYGFDKHMCGPTCIAAWALDQAVAA